MPGRVQMCAAVMLHTLALTIQSTSILYEGGLHHSKPLAYCGTTFVMLLLPLDQSAR
jgi:hypothetical protein